MRRIRGALTLLAWVVIVGGLLQATLGNAAYTWARVMAAHGRPGEGAILSASALAGFLAGAQPVAVGGALLLLLDVHRRAIGREGVV